MLGEPYREVNQNHLEGEEEPEPAYSNVLTLNKPGENFMVGH